MQTLHPSANTVACELSATALGSASSYRLSSLARNRAATAARRVSASCSSSGINSLSNKSDKRTTSDTSDESDAKHEQQGHGERRVRNWSVSH